MEKRPYKKKNKQATKKYKKLMGALTLKSLPFEVRGWDILSMLSVDPTDGLGASTRVYITEDQVVQIEPDYDPNYLNLWLSDKGRQFFDAIFRKWEFRGDAQSHISYTEKSWELLFQILLETIYIFSMSGNARNKTKLGFLTIIFQNLGVTTLASLNQLEKKYSFVKLKKLEKENSFSDFESNFQLNLTPDYNQMSEGDYISRFDSQICLLISTNTRYEGYFLNLKLRQHFLKGDLKCFLIGSLTNLNFPVTFLGSNTSVLKNLLEGTTLLNNQFIWGSHYPFFIVNSNLMKRNDAKHILESLKAFKNSRIAVFQMKSRLWNSCNVLNPTLYSVGVSMLGSFLPFSEWDLGYFSSLYLVNVSTENISEFKKISELRLIRNFAGLQNVKRLVIDQIENLTETFNELKIKSNLNMCTHAWLPTSNFFEFSDTFYNYEGFLKRTNQLIFNSETRNHSQIFQMFDNELNKTAFLNRKDQEVLAFAAYKPSNFKHFIFLNYLSVSAISNKGALITEQNSSFVFNEAISKFKKKTLKIYQTKLKFWLDDFFTGGKDCYSQRSLILSDSSENSRNYFGNLI